MIITINLTYLLYLLDLLYLLYLLDLRKLRDTAYHSLKFKMESAKAKGVASGRVCHRYHPTSSLYSLQLVAKMALKVLKRVQGLVIV